MFSAPVYCKTFIGRETHVETLRERYRVAASGSGSLVLISGEAGAGKTRLLTEFAAALKMESAFFAQGSCFDYVQSPFAPFLDAVRALASEAPAAWRPTQTAREALVRLMPELGEPAHAAETDSQSEKRRQLDALAECIASFARARPTVLAIDDLQWADIASLEFLQHAVPTIESARILLVATLREDARAADPLRHVISRLAHRPSVWQVELDRLTEREMWTLILTALEGHRRPSPEVLATIPKLAEGNPLFAEELLKNAVERIDQRSTRSELPLSLREAVLERLSDFSDDDRLTLTYAAVIGRRFEPEFLAEIVRRSIADVLRVLKRALTLQLIVERPEEPPCYEFRHTLTREAISLQLLAVEARALHARIAERIEASSDAAARVAELAYHWWEARDVSKAISYNERAGDAAAAVFAHDDAALFYERASQLEERFSEKHANLCEKLGSALAFSGFPERAIAAFEKAVAYYRSTNNAERSTDLLLRIGAQQWEMGQTDHAIASGLQALATISSRAEHVLYRAALVRVARWYALRGDLASASDYLFRAEQTTSDSSADFLADFYSCRGLMHHLRGAAPQAIDDYRNAIDFSDRANDPYASIRSRGNLGYSALCLGEIDIAVQSCDEAARLSHEKAMPLLESWSLYNRVAIEIFAGKLSRARELLSHAMTAEMGTDDSVPDFGTTWLSLFLGLRLQDEELIGRWAREQTIEAAFVTGGQYVVQLSAAFAELYAQRGENDKARALLHRAVSAVVNLGSAPWLCSAVAMYGDPADLASVRTMLVVWSQADDNRAAKAYLSFLDAYGTRAHADRSVEHAREAAERFAKIRFSYYQAVALELANDRAEALDIYRNIDDHRDAQRLERALTPVNRRGRSKTALTERERQVAALVAAGKSNRAIAEDLFISERTVESHVESIFGKLGFSTRAQVGAYIGRDSR